MAIVDVPAGPVKVRLVDDCRVAIKSRVNPFEPITLAEWATYCQPGSHVLDIGAYSGIFSIAAAKLGAAVTAFEPFPNNRARLLENIAANFDGSHRITVVGAAVSEAKGVLPFGYNARVRLTSGGSLQAAKHSSIIEVPVVKLDDYLQYDRTRIQAIKIDVEGAELSVIKGAARTLRRHKPALIIELLTDRSVGAMTSMLAGMYKPVRVMDERNYLYLPSGA